MNKARVVGGLVAVVLLTAIMAGCGSNEPEATQPEYTTVPVERGDVIRTLYVPGELVLTDMLTLSSPVDSELLDLLVKPGQQVKKGDILAHLDKNPFEEAYEDAVAQAEDDLEAAKSSLKSAEDAYEDAVAQAQANLEAAEHNLKSAEHSLKSAEHSLKSAQYSLDLAKHAYDQAEEDNSGNSGDPYRLWIQIRLNREAVYLAEDRVDVAQDAVNAAWQQVEDAEKAVEEAREDKELLGEATKRFEDAEEALAQAKEDKNILDAADIRAPSDGMVLDIKFREGDMVTKDSPMIVLADLSQMELMVTIGQDNIISIRAGMSAEITLDAAPGTAVKGKVDYMLPQKSPTSQTVTYEVYLSLGEVGEGLLPGMTGGATILVAEKHDVLRLPRRLVKIAPDGSGRVEVLEQGQPVAKKVVIGVRGDTHYEIVSGLSEGDLAIQRGRF